MLQYLQDEGFHILTKCIVMVMYCAQPCGGCAKGSRDFMRGTITHPMGGSGSMVMTLRRSVCAFWPASWTTLKSGRWTPLSSRSHCSRFARLRLLQLGTGTACLTHLGHFSIIRLISESILALLCPENEFLLCFWQYVIEKHTQSAQHIALF